MRVNDVKNSILAYFLSETPAHQHPKHMWMSNVSAGTVPRTSRSENDL